MVDFQNSTLLLRDSGLGPEHCREQRIRHNAGMPFKCHPLLPVGLSGLTQRSGFYLSSQTSSKREPL